MAHLIIASFTLKYKHLQDFLKLKEHTKKILCRNNIIFFLSLRLSRVKHKLKYKNIR